MNNDNIYTSNNNNDNISNEILGFLTNQLGKILPRLVTSTPMPIGAIYKLARFTNYINLWRGIAITQSGIAGGTLALPGINWMGGLAADLVALLYTMAVTAYGVGAIVAKRKRCFRDRYTDINQLDYIDILAVWADAPEYIMDEQVRQYVFDKLGRDLSWKAGSKTALKVITKSTIIGGKKVGVTLPQKLVSKIAAKMATKLSVKGAAVLSGIGVGISAGINIWFVNEISQAAEIYYDAKFKWM